MTNYRIRELVSGLKGIACDQVISYTAIASMRFDPEMEMKRLAADRISHEIAGDVMRQSTWQWVREPHGEVIRVRGYWLDYESLCRLLEDAYSMGRCDAPTIYEGLK